VFDIFDAQVELERRAGPRDEPDVLEIATDGARTDPYRVLIRTALTSFGVRSWPRG